MKTQVNHSLFSPPRYAYPTLLLFLFAFTIWLLTIFNLLQNNINLFVGFILLVFSQYLLFTPLHDATHQSISQVKFINTLIGRLSGYALAFAPFKAFRHAHLEHHKYTNEDAFLDPDAHSAPRGKVPLILKFISQDLYYYYWYFQKMGKRPKSEAIEIILTVIANIIFVSFMLSKPQYFAQMIIILISHRVTIGILAYSFDYLPHRPHNITKKDNQYLATHNLYLKNKNDYHFLSCLMLNQNYHLLHHLFPAVPFYHYGKAWRSREEYFFSKGGKFKHLFLNDSVEKERVSI